MASERPKETSIEERERKLRHSFEELSGFLRKWGKLVDRHIEGVLKREKDFHYDYDVKIKPGFRVKDSDSFIKKALYRKNSGKNYEDPLLEVEDKVGTRVVVLTSQHMALVKEILMASGFWDCAIGRDKALIKESIKEFDYEAIHLIVKPLATNKKFPEEVIPFLTCEIQIKTLFQHAYSEISHDTVYKGPYRHDLKLLRKLARSMALLESTDENFNSMYSYINSGEGLAIGFLQQLILEFKQVNPAFDEKRADLDLDSYFLDELMGKRVLDKLDMEDISTFVESHQAVLKRIYGKPNLLIGKHPVMILLCFLLKYSHEYLYGVDIDIDMLQALAFQLNVNYEPNA